MRHHLRLRMRGLRQTSGITVALVGVSVVGAGVLTSRIEQHQRDQWARRDTAEAAAAQLAPTVAPTPTATRAPATTPTPKATATHRAARRTHSSTPTPTPTHAVRTKAPAPAYVPPPQPAPKRTAHTTSGGS